jgi:hypothetical protein
MKTVTIRVTEEEMAEIRCYFRSRLLAGARLGWSPIN